MNKLPFFNGPGLSILRCFLSLLLVPALFFSCNKEEPIPAYIRIDSFTFTTNYSVQGSASHKIQDAWIYIDDQLVGAFEMPCTVPVLYFGEHTLKVLPGVKENGISETRIPYPFYERYEAKVTLTAGQILTVAPTSTYAASADFSWMEDFEGAGHSICKNTGAVDSVMEMIQTPEPGVFEGSGSGGFFLTNANSYFGMTCNKYVLPKAGAAVFLEINYSCNTDFNIGIVGYDGSGGIEVQSISLTLRPTSGWNKVYVNLTNEVTAAVTSGTFSIFFSMIKNQDIPTSYAYVDNIKLIN